VDLYLVGSGLLGTLHFTVETLQALEACNVVFILHDDLSVHRYIEGLGPRVVDLAEHYDDHRQRSEVYRSISEHVVRAACDDAPVACLVHGNPLFLVSASEYTLELARRHDLGTAVLPAVSSFDTVLCDLGTDFGYELQIFDATTLVTRRRDHDPSTPTLIFQLASMGASGVIRDEPDPLVLHPLQQRLLRSYPAHHEMFLVYSSTHVLERSEVRPIRLDGLSRGPAELWRRPSLYIPPVSP
jgi:uncharacterized protein YabN with tetrapyrrole methylase and pyrophosphatase domain